MFEVIPSPGTADKEWATIAEKIERVLPFARTIHIDVLDGKFAKNTTFSDPAPFAKYTKNAFFEVHLMVQDPLQYIQPFADAGFRRFIGQVEQMPDQLAFVTKAETLGEVGLAIDGKTELGALSVPLIDLDTILIMTINAGFSGQAFMEEKLQKVRDLKQKFFGPIEVDGGINEKTIPLGAKAGATRFVSTSSLFAATDIVSQYHMLLENAQRAGSEE